MARRSKQQAISFFTASITVVQDKDFFEKINLIDFNILQQNYLPITKNLLFGCETLENNALLTPATEFIKSAEIF